MLEQMNLQVHSHTHNFTRNNNQPNSVQLLQLNIYTYSSFKFYTEHMPTEVHSTSIKKKQHHQVNAEKLVQNHFASIPTLSSVVSYCDCNHKIIQDLFNRNSLDVCSKWFLCCDDSTSLNKKFTHIHSVAHIEKPADTKVQ